ncbi:hypothetical protein ACFOTA_05905 [Chitinophaga sp. GCM10012297]|uniref:DUF4843 domain-containing protein n=1 Tax=Chitinophaga chungangae TaxID=2821488 RepID=A0ABS3YAL6_9BACT|nr:hypothetical protein [Chitinophaga chungangae]MBO9151732.1 hypothetical protein [Chitinophaga chungangae]
MNLTFTKKYLGGIFVFFAAVALLASCKKDPVNPLNNYPKDVNIEYRVKSTTGITKADIMFDNQTGGQTSLDEQALPYSVKFRRTGVTYATTIGLGASTDFAGTVVLEIVVDDKVVKTETFTATSVVRGTIAYGFN